MNILNNVVHKGHMYKNLIMYEILKYYCVKEREGGEKVVPAPLPGNLPTDPRDVTAGSNWT